MVRDCSRKGSWNVIYAGYISFVKHFTLFNYGIESRYALDRMNIVLLFQVIVDYLVYKVSGIEVMFASIVRKCRRTSEFIQ